MSDEQLFERTFPLFAEGWGMKERFPIFRHHPNLIYLDSAATTHKPREMIEALTSFYEKENATVHRAVYRSSLIATDKYNGTRESVRRFLNAEHLEEIVFTRGTTEALNLAAQSFGKIALSEGDEILISQAEHHSNIIPWQMIAKEKKASLRYIPIDEKGVLLWQGMIGPKTKIVALAHVSNVTGTVNPIEEIAKAAHEKGAVVVVDGAQGAPHMPVDVQKLGCDFYAFSGHKCYGPTGVGILYGKRELLEKMGPIQGGSDMIERVDLDAATFREPPLRFETGTPIIAPVVALKASLDFIEEIGRKNMEEHGQKLLKQAEELLQRIPGLRILGRAPKKGPIVTFTIEGVHPLDIATLLDLENIAVRSGHLCAQPLLRFFGKESALRASFAIYNTEEEIDRFAKSLSRAVFKLQPLS